MAEGELGGFHAKHSVQFCSRHHNGKRFHYAILGTARWCCKRICSHQRGLRYLVQLIFIDTGTSASLSADEHLKTAKHANGGPIFRGPSARYKRYQTDGRQHRGDTERTYGAQS